MQILETKTINQPASLNDLKEARAFYWSEILSTLSLAKTILNGDFDKRFYAIYLIETYHYVIHNPRHQAMVGVLARDMPFNYVKFCYEHAEEETGHEMMAYHDLLSLGLDKKSFSIPRPMNSTEVLIAYLYWVSSNGNHLQRLGYSFWAEDSYGYVGPLINKVRDHLNLDNSQMTFLVSHATIDEAHSQEIESMLSKYCKSQDDWMDINRVMYTSLKLQAAMLEEINTEYVKLKRGEPSQYGFLNTLI